MPSDAVNRVVEYQRELLREMLGECTPAQQNTFNLMYGSVDSIPREKMDWAMVQCERTIAKNRAAKGEPDAD